MVRVIAAIVVSVVITGCAGGGDGALSVEEARYKPASEIVRIEGPVVIDFGRAMICTRLADSSPPQCDAGFWLSGRATQLRQLEFKSEGSVRWVESATLEGRVDGGGFFVLT